MNKFLPGIILFILFLGAFYIDKNRHIEEEDDFNRPLAILLKSPSYENGKLKKSKPFKAVYRANNLDSIGFFPFIDANFMHMMNTQERFLKEHKNQKYRIGKLSFSNRDLLKVINTLRAYQFTFPVGLSSQFDFYQIKGQDNKGNVKFSAYYTPMIKASRTKNSNYAYGIYQKPENIEMPSRQEIENGKLDDSPYVLGYVSDYQDVKKLKLQGSGILEFKDGTTKYIVYHTSNGMHQEVAKKTQKDSSNLKVNTKKIAAEEEILIAEEVSEDSLLKDDNLSTETTDNEEIVEINPAEDTDIEETIDDEITNQSQLYPFFMEVKKQKVSSTGMPLVPWYSIAVDKRYVPLGSCLLAATPIVDKKEKFKYHALQFVLAQDTGEAIRGTGRVDWYVGAGDKAAKIAQNIHHYGQLWLILPKKKKTDGLTKVNNSSTIKHSR